MSEMPDFAATLTYPQDNLDHLPSGGAPIWPDTLGVKVWGETRMHELCTMACSLGRVALFGDCFVDDDTLQAVLADAIRLEQPELLTHFPGSYATVLLDERGQSTILSSITGAPSLYYRENEADITVSTRPSLLAGTEGLSPRESHLAMYMLAPGHGIEMLLGEQSCFNGITKLSGGQALRTAHDQPARVYSYESLAPDRSLTIHEAGQTLRQELEEAVAARFSVGPNVSADMSGGLDSTSISFLAARHVGEGALSVFFAGVPDTSEDGDRVYAQRFAALDKRFDLRSFVLSPPASFSRQDFLRTPRPEELKLDATTPDGWLSLKTYYELINPYAGRLHLTGVGGDEVLKGDVAYLADVLRAGHAKRFLQETAAFARMYNMSPRILGTTIAELALNPARALERTAKTLRHTTLQDDITAFGWLSVISLGQPVGSGITWLTRQIRRDLADIFADTARTMRLPEGYGIGDYMTLESLHASAAEGRALAYLARATGVEYSTQAPFLDANVVRAAFSVLARLKGSPYDVKLLLKEALRGVIPDEVLDRRGKGGGDRFFGRILSNSRHALRAIARDSYLADIGIVDPAKILEAVERIDMMSTEDMYAFGRFLSAERWLRDVHKSNRPYSQRQQADQATIQSAATPPTAETISASQATLPKERLAIPGFVYAVSSDTGCLVLLNQHTNKYHTLDRTQSDIIRSLATTGDIGRTAEQFVARYPKADSQMISADIVRCVENLQSLGLITKSDILPSKILPKQAKEPRFVSAEWVMARAKASDSHNRTHVHEYLLTIVARGIDELLSHGTMARFRLPLLQRVQQGWCSREASYEEAQSLLRTVLQLPWIGRIACREAAYTAALAAALGKKTVSYHLGVSFQPIAFHAWIEAEDKPIRTELDGKVVGSFQSFFA